MSKVSPGQQRVSKVGVPRRTTHQAVMNSAAAAPCATSPTATATAAALASDDVEITLVKEAGHRFSEPDEIARLVAALDRMTAKTG